MTFFLSPPFAFNDESLGSITETIDEQHKNAETESNPGSSLNLLSLSA